MAIPANIVSPGPETDLPVLDEVDAKLLAELQRNGRATYAELAAAAGLKPPGTHDRVRRLEERGMIQGYGARLDPRQIGVQLVAFISCFTTAEERSDDFAATASAMPEVAEIHSVAGDESYILKVNTRSTSHLDELLSRLRAIPGVARTKTTVVLSTPFARVGYSL
jgi:Lrp/AsnC family transcriptional regulator, leucine-responsive regulatory protein